MKDTRMDLVLNITPTYQSCITELSEGTGLLSGKALWPNKLLFAMGGRFRFGESCCGVNELLPGNMPDVGVTWPDKELDPNPVLERP
ncbi:hypothetical protein J6590_023822 [Homalodisca vitripennis]|nr:hypothetical protein J6590_023822 [Homalodisca vitripennis]